MSVAARIEPLGICEPCAVYIHDIFGEEGYVTRGDRERGEARAAYNAAQPRRGKVKDGLRLQVFKRDGYRCVKCGSQENLHCDHIFPASLGGQNRLDNLQTLCAQHNLSKGAKVEAAE